MSINIGFIGTGNMGAALIKGIVKSGKVEPCRIFVYDIDFEKAKSLKNEAGINVLGSNAELVEKSDIVFLAVKPSVVKKVLDEVKNSFSADKILVSIAVGVPIKLYKSILGANSKVIRSMPNTPAMIGEGMTLISYDDNISENEAETVKMLFGCVGLAEVLDEKLMSEVTALTSSSPAYVFMFIEAMADAAVLSGIPRNLAYKLASQAVAGSAKMIMETGRHPAELKDQVCSPAGTTIEAVSVLEKNGFRYAVIEAMDECTKKARLISSISENK